MNYTEARRLFAPLASISNVERSLAPQECRNMIDMARIMVNTNTVNLEENGRKKNNNPIQGEWLPKTAMPIAESDNFTIFPNPTNGTFEMRLSTAVYNIEVRNMLGQTVFNMVGNGTDRIDATTWQSGLYLLTAKNQATGKMYSTKVVKE